MLSGSELNSGRPMVPGRFLRDFIERIMKESAAAVSQKLAELDRLFNPQTQMPKKPAVTAGYHTRLADGTPAHETRLAMDYALLCLSAGTPERNARAALVIDAVLKLQVIDPMDQHFGIWGWFAEEPPGRMDPADWNWADFIGARIAEALVLHSSQLASDLTAGMKQALDRAAMCIFRRQSPIGYTNIAIMGAGVSAVAGELLDRPVLLDYGRRKLQEVMLLAKKVGTFSEYNSPTYTIVAIEECERVLRLSRDPALTAMARQLLDVAWDMIAQRWHAPTGQWAGPHGRAYSDRVAADKRHKIEAALADRPALPLPRFVSTPVGADAEGVAKVAHTFLDRTSCIGSITREHTWTQRRPIIAYWLLADGLPAAVFKVEFLLDGRATPGLRLATSQVDNRLLVSGYPLHGCGVWHPYFHVPADGQFDLSDLRLRFALEAAGATVTQILPGRYRLSAGDHAVQIDLTDCFINDRKLSWQTDQADGTARLDTVLVDTAGRVDFVAMRLKFAAAIQLLAPGTPAIDAPVTLVDHTGTRQAHWSGVPDVTVPIASQRFSF